MQDYIPLSKNVSPSARSPLADFVPGGVSTPPPSNLNVKEDMLPRSDKAAPQKGKVL